LLPSSTTGQVSHACPSYFPHQSCTPEAPGSLEKSLGSSWPLVELTGHTPGFLAPLQTALLQPSPCPGDDHCQGGWDWDPGSEASAWLHVAGSSHPTDVSDSYGFPPPVTDQTPVEFWSPLGGRKSRAQQSSKDDHEEGEQGDAGHLQVGKEAGCPSRV
jgi:hypothetical protein